ncbi:hypothetical protein Daus18300_007950 [Diaporthe australafricana]|uniref:Protein NO VEIN C-terminal domain-containing protein n=1 Tax=Diaporthe australafricana TaxID=127596 RepID=A0ABR3WKJ4_9PEZI
MSTIDRREARELVRRIAKDHGYLGEETLSRIEPEVRREIEEALLNKNLLIGSSVITLAKEVYSSKARFVFELLQNADDNSYTKAIAANQEPYVSFRIYPHRIVLECNEDGFTPENLKAICSVGRSSKKGAQGYIGEKGIGFKSVFMAAWKVHIQSSAFSFSFSHRNGESGMGMISPVWEPTDEELTPMTKMTLHLHETGNPETLAVTHAAIQEQSEQLKETILLFMKNLRGIYIEFYSETGEQKSSTSYTIQRPRINCAAVLKRVKPVNGTTDERLQHFHVTDHKVTNLAKNEARNYSQAEEETRAYSSSQITLAFPLSEDSVPIVEPQDLFVFLPVRRVGFNFLIQADFVTDASRQDIVKDSPRNWGLLDGVANAFVKAVLQFCQQDTTRYTWMRFLPDRKGAHMGTLWRSLVDKIAEHLSSTRLLYGNKSSALYTITHLVRPGSDVLDEDGKVLLDDNPEQLISYRYDGPDLDTLSDYGLKRVTIDLFHKWLKIDLRRGPFSRMKSLSTSETWHTQAATMIQRSFNQKWDNHIAELKRMDLLPLEDGTWVSIISGPVYFAQARGIDIPIDIGLRLLSTKVKNTARRTLFKHLGVQTASLGLVRQRILQRCDADGAIPAASLENSRQHLEFLYLTQSLERAKEDDYECLEIYDAQGEFWSPSHHIMYVTSDDPHSASELFSRTEPGPNPGDGAPGYNNAIFINKAYFQDCPSTPKDEAHSWVDWFLQELGAKRFVDGWYGIKYVQKHRPEKFMDCLRISYQLRGYVWASDKKTIREMEVLCRGNHRVPLTDAYFPIKRLEELVDRFIEPGAFFPWIWLDTNIEHDGVPPEWKGLLNHLDIGSPPTDLDFLLAILKHSFDTMSGSDITSASRKKLFDLYEHIQLKYWGSTDQAQSQQKIKKLFSDKICIYIPRNGAGRAWAKPEHCVWTGLQDMTTKFPLQQLYQQFLNSTGTGRSRIHLTDLFVHTLEIPDCTWETYLDELKALKSRGRENSDTITEVYEALNELRPKIVANDIARDAFEKDALVYLPTDDGPAWHKTSQCVWSTAARLRGRVSLNEEYANLKELFVGLLGVKPVDLNMAIDELAETGSSDATTTEELRESIWTVSSLLLTEKEPPRPGNILKKNIFPVKYPNGAVQRLSITTEFFLVDREPLKKQFETLVKFLDFTLEDVNRLRLFIQWAGLTNRYLSLHVKEVTSFHGIGAGLMSDPERQLCNRTHALVRIAHHFRGPRTESRIGLESLYGVLRDACLYETDDISSNLQLNQDGKLHTVLDKRLVLHLEDASGLKVYLPRGKDDQEYACGTILPERLLEWMMRDPTTQIPQGLINKDGINATMNVLLVPRSRTSMSLEQNGIGPINLVCLEEDFSDEPESPSPSSQGADLQTSSPVTLVENIIARNESLDDGRSEASRPLMPRASVEQPSRNHFQSIDGDSDSDAGVVDTPASRTDTSRQSIHSATTSIRSAPLPLRPSRPVIGQEDALISPIVRSDAAYVALLDKVIQAARWTTIPAIGANGMAELRGLDGWNGVDLSAAWGDENSLERNRKVGAAGELFFSRENWQSTIRRYVTGHRNYQDMQPWFGRETSDITYSDREGVLTDFFVEKGYLERDLWADERPEYFIEVKTTNMSCETPFFMSNSQYRRMRNNLIPGGDVRDVIYVIFRVYNLGCDGMGLKIYLDPESLRLSGELSFTADTWSVVPGSSATRSP